MKKIDIIILVLLPVFALVLHFLFKTNLLISDTLFFGLPSLYLIIRNPGICRKSVIFALVMFILVCPLFDVLGYLDGSWVIPYTVLPFKFFGVSTVENYIFGLLWCLLSILFYEHFFDKGKIGDKINKKLKNLFILGIFLTSLITAFFFYNLQLLVIPYFYLIIGVLCVVSPLAVFLYYYPRFLKRFVLVGIYFFFLLFIFEIAALHNGEWIFPGVHFIGLVQVSTYTFPLEEFIFWMMFCTPSLICYYEFFADDMK